MDGACMKQGKLVPQCVIRRGPEKGRGWLVLLGDPTSGDDVVGWVLNLRRGVSAACSWNPGAGGLLDPLFHRETGSLTRHGAGIRLKLEL